MYGQQWTNEEIELLRDNYHLKREDLLRLFPNRKYGSLNSKAFTLKLRKPGYTPNNNVGVLLEDVPESYYWVGFLLADGCIHNNSLTLTSTVKDIEHIEKFRLYINAENCVRRFFPTNSYSNTERCGIGVYHRFDVSKIQDKFDWKHNKTYNPPRTIPNEINHVLSLLIGYIDGDGSILNRRKSKAKMISFQIHVSWHEWLLMIHNSLESYLGYAVSAPKKDKDGYCSWHISNTTTHQTLKRFALSNNLPILNRKWDRIDLSYVSKKNSVKNRLKEIFALYDAGMNAKQISKELGCSHSVVCTWINKRKVGEISG